MLTNPALTVALRFLVLANFTRPAWSLAARHPRPFPHEPPWEAFFPPSAWLTRRSPSPTRYLVSGTIAKSPGFLGIRAYLYFSLALALSLALAVVRMLTPITRVTGRQSCRSSLPKTARPRLRSSRRSAKTRYIPQAAPAACHPCMRWFAGLRVAAAAVLARVDGAVCGTGCVEVPANCSVPTVE